MTKNIKVLGLCGRSGSGKGYVCSLFSEYSIPSIDTDAVYRAITESGYPEDNECLRELSDEFGPSVINIDGGVNRKALADIVFANGNKDKLSALNGITHKYILKETECLIEEYAQKGYKAVIIDAPVLFESGFDRICDYTMCVVADDETLVERICRRDSIEPDKAISRLSSQKACEELISLCDAVIYNHPESELEHQIREIISRFELMGGNDEKQ